MIDQSLSPDIFRGLEFDYVIRSQEDWNKAEADSNWPRVLLDTEIGSARPYSCKFSTLVITNRGHLILGSGMSHSIEVGTLVAMGVGAESIEEAPEKYDIYLDYGKIIIKNYCYGVNFYSTHYRSEGIRLTGNSRMESCHFLLELNQAISHFEGGFVNGDMYGYDMDVSDGLLIPQVSNCSFVVSNDYMSAPYPLITSCIISGVECRALTTEFGGIQHLKEDRKKYSISGFILDPVLGLMGYNNDPHYYNNAGFDIDYLMVDGGFSLAWSTTFKTIIIKEGGELTLKDNIFLITDRIIGYGGEIIVESGSSIAINDYAQGVEFDLAYKSGGKVLSLGQGARLSNCRIYMSIASTEVSYSNAYVYSPFTKSPTYFIQRPLISNCIFNVPDDLTASNGIPILENCVVSNCDVRHEHSDRSSTLKRDNYTCINCEQVVLKGVETVYDS